MFRAFIHEDIEIVADYMDQIATVTLKAPNSEEITYSEKVEDLIDIIEPAQIVKDNVEEGKNEKKDKNRQEKIADSELIDGMLAETKKEEAKREETKEEKFNKKLIKNALKRVCYDALSKYTNYRLPWGILTGIRPTKIVHELIHEGKDDNEIDSILENTYKISPNKRNLMIQVAKRELSVLDNNKPGAINIYIGIPFCPTRCVYCSFTAYSLEKCSQYTEPYLEALFKEIEFVAGAKKNANIHSLYIGGGTPTSLNEDQLESLLKHIKANFDLSQIEEYTIEAGRPDTITPEKLRIMKQYGVSRISINPQTMNQKTLDLIGRRHSVENIIEVFEEARKAGHDNINMDIILGLPGETPEDVEYTISELKKLKPENITVHTMAIKRASRLREIMRERDVNLTQAKDIERMLEICEKEIAEIGLVPYYMYRQKNMLGNYENVGYATKDTFGIYNIEIMEEAETIIALGAGAITKIVYGDGTKIDRVPNVKSLTDYINRIDEMIERKKEGFIKYV